MALRRAEDAETTLEETTREKETLVARVAELEKLNEEANRERRAAERALKHAEAKVKELGGRFRNSRARSNRSRDARGGARESGDARKSRRGTRERRRSSRGGRRAAHRGAGGGDRRAKGCATKSPRDARGNARGEGDGGGGLEKITRDAEATAKVATNGLDANDRRWGEVQAEVAAFCEAKGEELDATESR